MAELLSPPIGYGCPRHVHRDALKDAKELLDLKADPDADRREVRDKATKKVGDIDQKIRDLQAMREDLTSLIAECHGDGPAARCPIITAISGETDER